MRHLYTSVLLALAAQCVGISASSTPAANNLLTAALSRSERPSIDIGPKHPGSLFPVSSARTKVCIVDSNNDGTDDSPAVLAALHECNDGGHVIFSRDARYTIGTALDLTFLRHVDLDIQGYVQFTNDTDYWQAKAFYHTFQNSTTFFQLGGEDVNVYGGGTLDGSGQVWYDLFAQDIYILRPILFGTIGLRGGFISNLNLRYSPQWFNLVANSSNVVFSNITIAGGSVSKNPSKNTDGWDTYRSDSIVIQNSHIDNGDDCVSFKPNSTNIVVQNLICNGSHGISVGSLGQYVGEVDIVANVSVYNISMSNASDGARIKVWPGISSELSGDLQGGGGSGAVRNVTYEKMEIFNVDNAITITQCYGQKNSTLCNLYPSNLTISDISISDISGTTSARYEPRVGSLVCSSPDVCSDIRVSGVSVKSPGGFSQWECRNVGREGLEIGCVG